MKKYDTARTTGHQWKRIRPSRAPCLAHAIALGINVASHPHCPTGRLNCQTSPPDQMGRVLPPLSRLYSFCSDLLLRGIPQEEIQVHPFEAAILCSNSLNRFTSDASDPTVLCFPLVAGRGANPVMPPDLVDGPPASASFRIDTI